MYTEDLSDELQHIHHKILVPYIYIISTTFRCKLTKCV